MPVLEICIQAKKNYIALSKTLFSHILIIEKSPNKSKTFLKPASLWGIYKLKVQYNNEKSTFTNINISDMYLRGSDEYK